MKICVCIPVFNRIEYTLKCLESLKKQSYRDFNIIVCDHGSTDGTTDKINLYYPDVIVLNESSNLWWTGATNRCVEYVMNISSSNDNAVVTLNNDLEVDENYLFYLVEAAKQHPNAIITSAGYDIRTRNLIESGHWQSWYTSKVRMLDPDKDYLLGEQNMAEVTHAPGRGTLIPLKIFRELGLYDEKHLPHYGADYDFTYRARRNDYRILISYDAKVYSHVEATGMTSILKEFSFSSFKRYLTDIKSPANISVRWWIAINNCPRLLFPTFFIFDLLFVVGSYFKFHILKKIKSLDVA